MKYNTLSPYWIGSVLWNALYIRRLMHPHHLSSPWYWQRPGNPPFNELLDLRPQLCFRQGEIIHRASAQDSHSREASATSVHKRSTRLAEVVRHARVRTYRLGLAEGAEVVLATDVLEVRICHGDVGLVEGRADLAAVDAVADVAVHEAGSLKWLEWRKRE